MKTRKLWFLSTEMLLSTIVYLIAFAIGGILYTIQHVPCVVTEEPQESVPFPIVSLHQSVQIEKPTRFHFLVQYQSQNRLVGKTWFFQNRTYLHLDALNISDYRVGDGLYIQWFNLTKYTDNHYFQYFQVSLPFPIRNKSHHHHYYLQQQQQYRESFTSPVSLPLKQDKYYSLASPLRNITQQDHHDTIILTTIPLYQVPSSETYELEKDTMEYMVGFDMHYQALVDFKMDTCAQHIGYYRAQFQTTGIAARIAPGGIRFIRNSLLTQHVKPWPLMTRSQAMILITVLWLTMYAMTHMLCHVFHYYKCEQEQTVKQEETTPLIQ
jgi:hypothetical protein